MIIQILIPVSIIGGLSLLFGLGLSFVSKKFEVESDERIALVREALPGANCGACGHSGCDAFAEAVVEGNAKTSGCPVGGTAVSNKLAQILGVENSEVEEKVAQVLCNGTLQNCKKKYDYQGVEDCASASAIYGGPSACLYGCMGFGTCAKACPFDAIIVEDGVAKVMDGKCTGCGVCIKTCPKNIIKFVPKNDRHVVTCSSLDKGNIVRQACSVGCIGCMRCVKACTAGAIKMNDSLAVIDNKACTNCGECVKVCPTGAISALYLVPPELCRTVSKS